MTVLVTGSHGYVGPLVVRVLAELGVTTITCDAGWFSHAFVGDREPPRPHYADFTLLGARDLEGVSAIIHLAAYSNDPLGWLFPETTASLNHHATVRFAETARAAGVGTFVLSSSCSVYGDSHTREVDEDGPTNPLTPYAHSKLSAERDIIRLQRPGFRVAALRGATAFGASPVPRTDLLLNELCAEAACGRRLVLRSNGASWRPFMPIGDFARALVTVALGAPVRETPRPIWNIAPPSMQMTVREAAFCAAQVAGTGTPVFGDGLDKDLRSYRVDGSRFIKDFPSFAYGSDFDSEIRAALSSFSSIPSLEADLSGSRFIRLASLRVAQEIAN